MDLNVTRLEHHDGVAVITLHRPDRLNAWTGRMEHEYLWCLRQADADPEVRVIVVTGAGRGFCAGADMAALDGYAAGEEYDLTTTTAVTDVPGPADFAGTFSATMGLAKPVIAAINGAVAGVGFVLMCFTDIRFAAAGAKLTTSFARLGLPAEHGLSWVLPRLVGAGRAADLLFSSRVVLAEEAEAMGLVNRVLPADELLPATMAYATAMARDCAPSSLLAMKRQLWSDQLTTLEASWRHAGEQLTAMIGSEDFREGLAAFQDRRAPAFKGIAHG